MDGVVEDVVCVAEGDADWAARGCTWGCEKDEGGRAGGGGGSGGGVIGVDISEISSGGDDGEGEERAGMGAWSWKAKSEPKNSGEESAVGVRD